MLLLVGPISHSTWTTDVGLHENWSFGQGKFSVFIEIRKTRIKSTNLFSNFLLFEQCRLARFQWWYVLLCLGSLFHREFALVGSCAWMLLIRSLCLVSASFWKMVGGPNRQPPKNVCRQLISIDVWSSRYYAQSLDLHETSLAQEKDFIEENQNAKHYKYFSCIFHPLASQYSLSSSSSSLSRDHRDSPRPPR